MLFKLSFQNIRKSFKDYTIYFFTLILGIAIFYVFNSLESQTVLLNVSNQTRSIIELMMNMLSMVSVFVAFVLGFLIIYANRFLMKRRHKEFGIYMTLGMGKGQISKILFLETVFIGLLSLIVGLGLGVIVSQVMSVFVANMFEADMTHFTFVFSSAALLKTLLYFGVMYFLVMIFNTITVSRCRLITLIQASKKSEKIALKNPFLCFILFVIGFVSLAYAYYKVTIGIDTIQDANQIYLPIILGIVATFLIVYSISHIFLRLIRRLPKLYYRGLNSFIVRQVSSKINTMVVSMSVITLLLFLTICILSSALSIKNAMTLNLQTLVPRDLQIVKVMNLDEKKNGSGIPYQDIMNEADFYDTHLSILETLSNAQFDVSTYFQDIYEYNVYQIPDITLEVTLGSAKEKIKEKFPFMRYETKEEFIRLSDYNKLASIFGMESISLEQNEYVLVADYSSVVDIRNEGLLSNTPIVIDDYVMYPKDHSCHDGFIYMSSNHINSGIFVVPDHVLSENYLYENIVLTNYVGDLKEDKKIIEEKVDSISQTDYMKKLQYSVLSFNSKISIYESSIGLSALVTFIGIYLGIIFLVSSALVLALKELSESTDNKIRYQMLRKIGCDEKLIHKALFYQIAIFFLFPLVFAIVHSIFGIQFCNYILETFGDQHLLKSIIMMTFILIFIYGGYFVITYYTSKNIIKNK